MTIYSDYFQQLHTKPTGWLDLFEELSRAYQELPKSSYLPQILLGPNGISEESAKQSLRAAFAAVSTEVGAAAGDRFQDGCWPNEMSAEAAYFLGVILAGAKLTVATIAPTPERSLKPTIFPFPQGKVSEVALWFATEWWMAYGGPLYEIEMCKRLPV